MDDDDPTDQTNWTENTDPNTTTALITLNPSDTFPTTLVLLSETLETDEDTIHYVQLASLVFISAIGFISNLLVLLLFYKRPTLRTFSNKFVLNLSISHLLQSVLILPTIGISTAAEGWLFGEITCFISGFLFTTLNITSVLSLLLIALDRNCAVNSPLHYSMTITKTRTGFLIFLTWFIGIMVGLPPFFGISDINYREQWHTCTLSWNRKDPYCLTYASVLVVLGFMIPLLITICVYSFMFQAAKDNSERARKHSVNSTSVDGVLPPPFDSQLRTVAGPQKKKCRRWSSGSNQFFGEEWKAVRTGMLVVTTFTFCWLPYFTAISLEAFFDVANKLPSYFMFVVVVCSSSACFINPYLYVFRNKTTRKHIKQLLCPSNLKKNKRWIFHRESNDKLNHTGVNPCILSASLENEGSEKVKALPALYQDIEGHWQVFSTSEEQEQSRDDLDETISNESDDNFFDVCLETKNVPPISRKKRGKHGVNVHSIYNNSYNRNIVSKNMSDMVQPNSSSKHILFRLKSSLNRDSTSSDITENCSISLESNNSTDHQGEADSALPTRRGIGKFLFNTSEELWDSKIGTTYHHKRVNTVPEGSSSSSESRKNLSSFGSARRKSFIHSHMKNRKSSETTLTSSNSDTIDTSSSTSGSKTTKPTRPRLVRQVETIQPQEEYEET